MLSAPSREKVDNLARTCDICGFGSFGPIYGAPRQWAVVPTTLHIKTGTRKARITMPVWRVDIRQRVISNGVQDTWTHHKTLAVGRAAWSYAYSKLRLDRWWAGLSVRFIDTPRHDWYEAAGPWWEPGLGWIIKIID